MASRTARTPVLTSEDCPGLTEIKNVRIRNNLLEEIFNVEDSIELDYFELERQEANFDNYLSGYNSPSNKRLSLELKPEDTGRGIGVESNGYQLHELQNRRFGSKDLPAGNVNQSSGLSVKYEGGGRELIAVASPTISSTCEAGVTGSVATGVGNIASASPVTDAASVHSTTNVAGHDSLAPTDGKTVVANKNQWNGREDEKTSLTVVEPVQGYSTTRENVRPRPESRHHSNITTTQQVSGIAASHANAVSGDPTAVTLISSGGQALGGDSTTASSSSTSPSQLHVTKRQRVIDCGSDLLAEVRQAYEYVQGADLYAPSSHPTFTNLDIAGVPSTFQPNTDQNGQPPMNFNFTGQTGGSGVSVAFVGRSRMGAGAVASMPQQAGVPYVGGGRGNTASPSVTYQSCPDLASPGRQPVPEAVAYSRFIQQRPMHDEETAASFSAPTTPSKRAGPWSANSQHLRSPMSPSLQAQWRSVAPVPREPSMPPHRQNVLMSNRQSTATYVQQDVQRCYEAGYNPYVQQFEPYSRPESPHIVPGPGRSVYHNSSQSRAHYTQPSARAFPGSTQMPAPRPAAMSDASRPGDGAPLSQNAFLRSVVDDENAVFRSHPLFPLLRDIIIADMNFHTPSFPFQLIANLPANFSRLVDNYMQRNPQMSSVKASDPHAESVVMDALAYAHAALIGELVTVEIWYVN